jgi:hypothetical protein
MCAGEVTLSSFVRNKRSLATQQRGLQPGSQAVIGGKPSRAVSRSSSSSSSPAAIFQDGGWFGKRCQHHLRRRQARGRIMTRGMMLIVYIRDGKIMDKDDAKLKMLTSSWRWVFHFQCQSSDHLRERTVSSG